MHARLLELDRVTERDLGAWRDLAARAIEPNPFFEADFVLAASAGLRPGRVCLVVVESTDGWEACLPVKVWRWRGVPLPCLASWRHRYCFLGTPLVSGADPSQALRALVDRSLAKRGISAIALTWIARGGAVAGALEDALQAELRPASYRDGFERALLVRRADANYLDDMRPHHRRELRRARRGLEREAGGPVEVLDRSGSTEAVEDFLSLEASGWKGRAGTAFASADGQASILHRACEAFAASGRLQLLAMTAGGRPVAMKCNFLAGDGVFCFKIAFDESFAKFSPGVQLEVENVDRFHQGSAAWMDSCADPDNDMINRLWPDRRRLDTVLLTAEGAFGWASRRSVPAFETLRGNERRALSPSS